MRVYRRGKIWFGDYRDPFGRRIRESFETGSKTEALAILAAKAASVREGKFFENSQRKKMQFNVLLDEVLAYQESLGRKSFKSFFVSYAKALRAFFGEKYLQEITPKMIEQFQFARAQDVSKATVNRSLAVLKRAFSIAVRWGYIKVNPVRQVQFFKEPRGRIRFLEKAEQDNLLSVCSGPLKDVVVVALRTGMRKSELLGLKKGDVDFQNNLILLTITKSDAPRQIPMIPEVRAVLSRLAFAVGEKDLLFRSKRGGPYRSVKTAFGNCLKKAGIKGFKFHDLRHTFASDLVMSGIDIFTVSKLLGHANVKTTMIYAHLSPDHKKFEMQKYQSYLEKDGTELAQSQLIAPAVG